MVSETQDVGDEGAFSGVTWSGVLLGYLVVALLVTLVVSPAPQLWIWWGLLAFHAAMLTLSVRREAELSLTVLTVLLMPVGLEAIIGPWGAAAAILPGIMLLDLQLREVAPAQTAPSPATGSRTTVVLNSLVAAVVAATALGLAVGNVALATAAGVCLAFICGRIAQVLISGRRFPIATGAASLRVLAGHQRTTRFELTNRSSFRQRIDLSPLNGWLTLTPNSVTLEGRGEGVSVEVTVTPPLAGPTQPSITAMALDQWGLIWRRTELNPISLHVIPRARYADWMARRYMEQSAAGEAMATRPSRVQRRGVEYARLREYQPGDRLKDLDWRAVLKFQELVTREYLDPQGGATLILVNLVAGNPEEADWLAYHLVTSALTAAQEGIPSALAAYDDTRVILRTGLTESREALKRAMRLSGEIKHKRAGERLLAAPDPVKMRRAGKHLSYDGSRSAALAEVLSREIESLEDLTLRHPLTDALRESLTALPSSTSIITISARNHDMEALAVTVPQVRARGFQVVELLVRQAHHERGSGVRSGSAGSP